MKKIIILTYMVILGLFICAFDEVKAQQNGPALAVPYGKGTGKTGFDFSIPPNYGALFAGTDNATAPAFLNIIRGQNYGSAMTNTGEAYGYSFRNSTTTGTAIYSAIFPGVSNQDGIQSVLNIPGTATLGSHGSAISAYFDNNVAVSGAGNNGVGLFSTGRCLVDSSACFGLNTLLQDASARVIGSGTGRILVGAEYDFNVMNPGTQVIGVSVGGNSLSQPTSAVAFVANTLGTGMVWDSSFYSQDGVSSIALAAGASATSGTSVPSQPIWLQYFNSSGTKRRMVLIANNNSLGLSSDDIGVNFTVGTSGINSGTISIAGGVSGAVTFLSQAAAGTYNFNVPTTAGSAGDLLTSGGGGFSPMTWTTPAALTKTDDTNVTLTLGGTPTTALLKATSITAGWTGTLAVARGGTGGGSASGTLLDNITGFASTGFLTRTGAGTYAFQSTTNGITVGNLAQIAANTVLSNWTGSTANVTANTWPSCSTTTSALQYTSGTGLSCYTSSASLAATGQTITGGAVVTSLSQSTGNITVDCGVRPLQYITNGGAYTITAPASDGSCVLLVTNNASAGSTSFSGFSVGSSTGDALTTTNTNKFSIFIWRINGTSGYRIAAHQ